MNTNSPSNTNTNRWLNCIQINLRHSKAASANLSQLLLDLKIDIALVQEPYAYISADRIIVANIPDNFTAFHDLSEEHAFGATIIVNNSLNPVKASRRLFHFSRIFFFLLLLSDWVAKSVLKNMIKVSGSQKFF